MALGVYSRFDTPLYCQLLFALRLRLASLDGSACTNVCSHAHVCEFACLFAVPHFPPTIPSSHTVTNEAPGKLSRTGGLPKPARSNSISRLRLNGGAAFVAVANEAVGLRRRPR